LGQSASGHRAHIERTPAAAVVLEDQLLRPLAHQPKSARRGGWRWTILQDARCRRIEIARHRYLARAVDQAHLVRFRLDFANGKACRQLGAADDTSLVIEGDDLSVDGILHRLQALPDPEEVVRDLPDLFRCGAHHVQWTERGWLARPAPVAAGSGTGTVASGGRGPCCGFCCASATGTQLAVSNAATSCIAARSARCLPPRMTPSQVVFFPLPIITVYYCNRKMHLQTQGAFSLNR
jgi:hypothetical protein